MDSENLNLESLEQLVKDGVRSFIIAGGFGSRGHEGKLLASKFCREKDIPCLGICFGFQMMVIDFCRNILNMDASSAEFEDKNSINVIVDMPEFKTDTMGGTMRLGKRMTIINKGSYAESIYKD